MSLITHRHVVSKPVRPSFIFGTQIKIFLMKSESYLTLHRQRAYGQKLCNKRCLRLGESVHMHCEGEKNGWVHFYFCFLRAKKYSRIFAKLKLSLWCHMDCFTDVFTTFLDLETFQLRCCLWRTDSSPISSKNILICVRRWMKVLRVGTTRGWVINDIISNYHFGVN